MTAQPEAAAAHVFLSYASADRERVRPVEIALRELGIPVWLDQTGIAGGANYGPEIASAIRTASAVMVMCSAASFASRNVRQEIALAWKHERPLIPLRLEPVEPPLELEYWLEAAQWIDVIDRNSSLWLPELLAALERCAFAIRPQSEKAQAPPGSGAERRVSLPNPLTALVGRERDLSHMVELIQQHRLVTLVGPGGVGKTRLAIAAGQRSLPDFESVLFADLSSVSDSRRVSTTIATLLDVRESPERDLIESIAATIGGRRTLLILDNVEHLLAAASEIGRLLTSCAELSVLATSRERLSLRGEQLFLVSPLTVPVERAQSTQEVLANPCIALFLDRSRDVRPDFSPDAAALTAIAQICRRLDGLPLAIELAAARSRSLSPLALLDRLEHALPTLTRGARDLPERHRTLRDTIAWSHNLLEPDLQLVFAQLGVFVGGFALDAAVAVVGSEPRSLEDHLEALTDQSLLQSVEQHGGGMRYRMLETIRAFATEQLEVNGDVPAVRTRHAGWCIALAESASPDLDAGRNIAEWFVRLDAELANLRAALAWLLESNDPVGALRLVSPLDEYWTARPYVSEAREWVGAGLEAGSDAPLPVRSAALHLAAYLAAYSGDHAAAVGYAEDGLSVSQQVGRAFEIGRAYNDLGLAWDLGGDPVRAAGFYSASVPLLRESGNETYAMWSLANFADMLQVSGNVEDAVPLLDDALAYFSKIAYPTGIAMVLGQRAHAARLRGEQVEAIRLFAESIETASSIGFDRAVLGALSGLAGVSLISGDAELASRLLGAVDAARVTGGGGRPAHGLHAEQIRNDAIAVLGMEGFTTAWNSGKGVSLEWALNEALSIGGSD